MTEAPEAVQQILHEALRRSWEDRPAYLDLACGDDAELRAEVESLLAHHEREAATTTTPPAVPMGPIGESETERSVKQIAPWIVSVGIHAGMIALGFLVTWSVGYLSDDQEPLLVTAQIDALSYDPLVTLDAELTAVEEGSQAGRVPAAAFDEILAEQRADLDLPPLNLELDSDTLTSRSDFTIEPEADSVTFLGLTTNATKIVYVIDASGSMIPTFQIIIEALLRSLGDLSSDQSYAVVFFQEDEAVMAPPNHLTEATSEAQLRTLKWIHDKVIPKGRSNPRKALEKALSFKPQVVFLLSENITGSGRFEIDQADLLEALDQANPDRATGGRRTQIKCVQFLDTDPINTLREIARRHGGRDGFKILDSAELGLE